MTVEREAAVPAGQTGARQSAARRRQIRDRIALGVAALLLVAGLVAYLQSRTDEGPAPTAATKAQAQTPAASAEQLEQGGKLEPGARKVAVRFLETAVGRTELDAAWNLSTPELRSGVTLKQWRAGALPVPPFPVQDLATTGFQVVASSPNKVLLQVLLVPKPGTDYVPTRYDMTIERASLTAPWKVSYCTPYAPPGMYAPTD
jgi:hypothetical protein